jgi:hypothetical protein
MNSSVECHELNATIRPKRFYLYLGLGGVIGYPAWAVIGIWIALTEPGVSHRGILLAIMGGIPLAFAALSAWILAAYCRERLTIQGNRITIQGIFRRVEFDLRDVTEARWRLWPEGGSVVLKTAATRVSIDFGTFEREEIRWMIDHLRSVIVPDIQTNWNPFDDKIAARLRRPKPTEPGPHEVLLRRDHWDGYLAPVVMAASLLVFVTWWITGELSFLAAPVIPLLGWLGLRIATPAEGMIAPKPSFSKSTEQYRLIAFLLIWGIVGFVALKMFEIFHAQVGHPRIVLAFGMIVWVSVVLYEVFRSDRRRSQRNRIAAELAAKGGGEEQLDATLGARDDHWSI